MHVPVFKKEVLEYFQKNKNYIDATFGQGGHAKEILKKIRPEGKLVAIEKDKVLYQDGLNLKGLILYNDSYDNLENIVLLDKISGVFFDLGFCTFHIEKSKKGFTFSKNEPLDMRYGQEGIKAYDIVNFWQKKDLEKILKEYGEEKYAKKIAEKIEKQRKIKKIENTFELVETIKRAVPYHKSKIHFATRTFQALRIAVNDELNVLKKGLEQAYNILEENGFILVITFHSLEDRIVKQFFKKQNMNIKLIFPSKKEVEENKKARSAKLRVGKKI